MDSHSPQHPSPILNEYGPKGDHPGQDIGDPAPTITPIEHTPIHSQASAGLSTPSPLRMIASFSPIFIDRFPDSNEHYTTDYPHHHHRHHHGGIDANDLANVEGRVEMYGGDDVRDPPLQRVDSVRSFLASLRSSRASIPVAEASGRSSISTESKVEALPDPLLVTWDSPDDKENPQNWSAAYKWFLTLVCVLSTVNVTFASSAPSSATGEIMKTFDISRTVSNLVTSIFLIGYVFGPLVWGPGSELVGRRPVFVVALMCYTLFHLGQALAPNIQTLLVTRFFGGFFAVAPLTNSGGLIADIWSAEGRGKATSLFSASVFLGPVLGPIVSGYIIQSGLSWRWVFWVMMIFAGVCTTAVIVTLPETYAPVILAKKAKRLREGAKNEKSLGLYAEHERQDWSAGGILHRTIFRPFQMLAMEPILVLVTIYLAVVYGLMYALFEAFPVIFADRRGFTVAQTGLTFIGVGIGTTLGAALNVYQQRDYPQLILKWRGFPPPENRLKLAMVGAPALVIGCFWLGWAGEYSGITWVVPALGAVIMGFGVCGVFMAFLSYLVDTYLMYSASAFAANTIVRSAVAAAFPLFTRTMFLRLGINWACTLIGLLALLFAPSPFLFYKYGPRIRESSQFAPCIDLKISQQFADEERSRNLLGSASRNDHMKK